MAVPSAVLPVKPASRRTPFRAALLPLTLSLSHMSAPPSDTSTTSIFQWLSQYLMDQLRLHGINLFLLGLAVWYFQIENTEMKSEIRACNDALIETYRVNQIQLLDVINNNTRALQDIPRN